MSWKNDVTKIVRALINDLDGTTYADSRIEEVAIVAAYKVYSEISFNNTYTITLSTETISPDPTSNSDNDFISLVALKAACIFLRSEAKTQASSAISMTDGPSSISLKGVYEALKSEADDVCKKYDEAKNQYAFNGSVGLAILGPYAPGSGNVGGRHPDNSGGTIFE
jgi:hypothetical protein